MIEIKFDPDTKDLINDLRGLSADLQRKALRSGIVSAIKPVKATMKQLAPKDTGALSQSIGHVNLSATAQARIGVSGEVGAGSISILVGSVKKVHGSLQSHKARWYDQGTSKGKKGSHATRATHFITGALEANEAGFDSRFYQGLDKYLKRAGFS